MRKHILQNKKITMIVNEEDGTFQIQTGRTKFLQQPPCAETDAAFSDKCLAEPKGQVSLQLIAKNVDQLVFQVLGAGLKELIVTFYLEEAYAGLWLQAKEEMSQELAYPFAFCGNPGDEGIFAYAQGVRIPLDDTTVPLQERRPCYRGTFNSMGFYGQLRGEAFLMTVIETQNDAVILHDRGSDMMLRTRVVWQPQKNQFAYTRKLRFYVGETGGLNHMCHLYRAYREETSPPQTLEEKASYNPNIRKMYGAANIWLWNEGMPERLYEKDAEPLEITDQIQQRRVRIAKEMKTMGMERVLWNDFDPSDGKTTEQLKALGYLTGCYDIYQDVIPRPMMSKATAIRLSRCRHIKNWPRDIRMEQDGSYGKCWYLTGKDGTQFFQNAMCDISALKCAMEDIPEDIKEKGYEAWLVDSVAAAGVFECFSPEHPMTRSLSLKYRSLLLSYMHDIKVVAGTECIHENLMEGVTYNEGNMSPTEFRGPDAGRRMTAMYGKEDFPENIMKFMLNPKYRIPLFEMVYHDCMISYWYWGDCQTTVPSLMARRDAFCALYGVPPLYSLNVKQWEENRERIAASYHNVEKVAVLTAGKKMLSFENLTEDCAVQRTCFEGGIFVTANFSSVPYTTDGGDSLQENEYTIERLSMDAAWVQPT